MKKHFNFQRDWNVCHIELRDDEKHAKWSREDMKKIVRSNKRTMMVASQVNMSSPTGPAEQLAGGSFRFP
jgi:hypothetical protein